MFARFRATVLLASIVVFTAEAETPGLARADTVSIYVDTGVGADSAPLGYMRREAENLMRSAGFHIDWRDAQAAREPDTSANVVVLRLNGACAPPAGQLPPASFADGMAPLASTPEVDGRVLPFSQVDCKALTRMLAATLNPEPAARRTWLYGRAMGRLVAHELYHVLAQTLEHSRNGAGKSCFTLDDLTAEVFEFEPGSLARLRRISGWNDPAVAAERTLPAVAR